MKLSYKKRVFFAFLIIYAAFSALIVYVEQKEEIRYKTQALENELDDYADIVHNYVKKYHLNDTNMSQIHELIDVLPEGARVTILKPDGTVVFDREVADVSTLENHSNRPEILRAQYQGQGSDIRMSTSVQQEFLYYAKSYEDSFVRMALPYNIEVQNLLKADNMFIYVVVGLFLLVLLLLNYAVSRFGKSITELKHFSSLVKNNTPLPKEIDFPEDELGAIGNELVEIFKQREKDKKQLEVEREKLIRHFKYSAEGFAIFSSEKKQQFCNSHFLQYLNLLIDDPALDANILFREEIFKPVTDFVDATDRKKSQNVFQINKNGRSFVIQTVIYEDKTFEVSIRDITQAEKTRLIKQEMTNNIAHELRTPVTSLRGYLETLAGTELSEEKRKQFTDRAYIQSIRLSNLIDDVSLLSKIEEPLSRFTFEEVNLSDIISEVRIDLADKIEQNNIKLNVSVRPDLKIKGNHGLIYSIFRNMIDNSINYAGDSTVINISNYLEDEKFVYFSYFDTGKGIDDKLLPRIFERFYRGDEGRTRESGASGLGLAIVRNAVLVHRGEIQAKNRVGAGLEFLFTLHK